jgi:hypothetical protein
MPDPEAVQWEVHEVLKVGTGKGAVALMVLLKLAEMVAVWVSVWLVTGELMPVPKLTCDEVRDVITVPALTVKLLLVVVAVVVPVSGPSVKLRLAVVDNPVPGLTVKLWLADVELPLLGPMVLFQFVDVEVRVPGPIVTLPWGLVPVRVGLGMPLAVGNGVVLFQSSHGDLLPDAPVQVLMWLYVPFVRVQHFGLVAVVPVIVPFAVTVPLRKGAPVVEGLVPFGVPVPVGEDVPVGREAVALAEVVVLGNEPLEGEVLMGPIWVPLFVAVWAAVQQLESVMVIELVTVEVAR